MNRRNFLAAVLGGVGVAIAGTATFSAASADQTSAVNASLLDEDLPEEPTYGAGLFDVDLDQDGVSQDPNLEVVSDVDALPEDEEF